MPENENELNEGISLGQRLSGIKRRRWWVLLTACGTALATIGVLEVIPSKYTSEATVLVVQQQVPQRYVYPSSTIEISDELQAMTEEVLSRTRLLGIIDEFGLYSKEKKQLPPEEVIDLMRKNIDIEPLKDRPGQKQFNAFKIAFTGNQPTVAQGVTSRLTSLFIEENLKTRADQAENTTNFLREQLDAAKSKLTEQEQRVREFKMHNLGELPEEQGGNMAILSGLQNQLQTVTASLSRAHEQRVYLESLISGYQALTGHLTDTSALGTANRVANPVEDLQADLAKLEDEKQKLLATYTSEHPSVLRVDLEIAQKRAALARLKTSEGSKSGDSQTPMPPAVQAKDETTLAQLKSQLRANQVEIDNLTKDEQRLKAATQEYQNRLNATPVREQQLSGIVRDYDLMKQDYADLLSKQEQSQLAASLEKHQEGEQFRLIDPPDLPAEPSFPRRLPITIAGALAGLVLGIGVALFKDSRERRFYSEEQLRHHIPSPLVVSLPIFRTRTEERRFMWKKAGEWVAGSVLVLMVLIVEVYVNTHG